MSTKSIFMSLALSAVAAVSCVEEGLPQFPLPEDGVTLKAVIESDQTRTALAGYEDVVWSYGDQIKVYTGGNSYDFFLYAGAGSSIAHFSSYECPEQVKEGLSVYPSSVAQGYADGNLHLAWPSEFQYVPDALQAPMIAEVENGTMVFKHLGGVLKFDVRYIPAEAVAFVFRTDADFTVPALADIDPGTTACVLGDGAGPSQVKVTFESGRIQDRTFLIPVPCGTYNGFTLELLDASGAVIEGSTKTASKQVTVNRADLKIYPAYEAGPAPSTKTLTVWENDGSYGDAMWGGTYRFARMGTDYNDECIAEIPEILWNNMRKQPFFVVIRPVSDDLYIRITSGWWMFDSNGIYDIMSGDERLLDNGDGSYTIIMDLTKEPYSELRDYIDEQHLLFTGSGYVLEGIYIDVPVDNSGTTIFWENDGSFDYVTWSMQYRFGLEGMDSLGECAATFPQDVWDRIKSSPFEILIAIRPDATWWQIRILDAWWTVGNDDSGESDITQFSEGVVDHADGTYTVTIDISNNEELLAVIDNQHLLFTGDGYKILQMSYK